MRMHPCQMNNKPKDPWTTSCHQTERVKIIIFIKKST